MTKIRKINNHLVGVAGSASGSATLMNWLENGADEAKWPDIQKDKDRWCDMLVITPERKIMKYEQEPIPFEIEETRYAIGSGKDCALAAMVMGADAVRAVEVASIVEHGCGNGIDTITFENLTPSDRGVDCYLTATSLLGKTPVIRNTKA
jgi:ATP-dependent protease HslVU (ClpYQ) peptidase subunit